MRALEIIREIFFCSFSSFFQILLCEASGRCFWDVQTMILYVRKVFLVVQTIRLIRPNIHSSCPDECVFTTSTWHYVRTSLNFCPDGEPCRVKSHSPWCRTSFSPLLLCFFLSSCAFSSCF